MELVFIGAGYVGLVSGVMLSVVGHSITFIDDSKEKLALLREKKLPLYEPGLDAHFQKALKDQKIRFTDDYQDIPKSPDAVFIAVGTPPKNSGEADLQYVTSAALQIAKQVPKSTIIVIKSTVPPGATLALTKQLRDAGYKNEVVSNPEFLSQGRAVENFMNPDRIVIGCQHESAAKKMREIYVYFEGKGFPILFASTNTAELIKYASNAFLATKIAFINEMANLCEKVDADVDVLAKGIGLDPRIGIDFLKTGPGFGGSCFPKDITALKSISDANDTTCYVLNATIESNLKRSADIINKIKASLGDLGGKTIGVLGLTFKAATDDVRSSPALEIVRLIAAEGSYVRAYDPEGMKNAQAIITVDLAKDYISAARGADALVILTEWPEFKDMDIATLARVMNGKIIFDYRNILDSKKYEAAGFKVHKLGHKA